MSVFCIVAYDLSRDKIGGVQNRMFRFIDGLKTQTKFTLVIFNLCYNVPFVDLSNKIKIYNYKTPSDLNKELLNFCSNNLIDYLYFADYRHMLGVNDSLFKKNRPLKIIASVPDIDLYRSKLSKDCSKKINLEKIFFKKVSLKYLDYFHVASESHKQLVKMYLRDKTINFIVSPVGLFLDDYKFPSYKKAIGITSIRKRSFKNNNDVINFVLKNKIIKKTYYFSDKIDELNNFNKSNINLKKVNNYEFICPYYKKALFNINLSTTETFANGLIEGAFFGAIPIINPINFMSFDLFKGNVIFKNEFNDYSIKDFQNKSKEVFKFARTNFNLKKNINYFLCELNG